MEAQRDIYYWFRACLGERLVGRGRDLTRQNYTHFRRFSWHNVTLDSLTRVTLTLLLISCWNEGRVDVLSVPFLSFSRSFPPHSGCPKWSVPCTCSAGARYGSGKRQRSRPAAAGSWLQPVAAAESRPRDRAARDPTANRAENHCDQPQIYVSFHPPFLTRVLCPHNLFFIFSFVFSS